MQTGASALLAAAAIATLYALVHFFDLFRREPPVAAEPRRVEFEPGSVADVPVRENVRATLARIEEQLSARSAIEEAPLAEVMTPEEAQPVEPVVSEPVEPVEATASQPAERRQAKAPRKARASKKAKASEPIPVEEGPVVEFAFQAEPVGEEPRAPADAPVEVDEPPTDEQFHPPVAPLFEPEPFVRQQRATFGRKAG